MMRRLLGAGLCLALLLGPLVVVHQTCAKPHDLPLNQKNTVKPQVTPEDGFEVPPTLPVRTEDARPTGRPDEPVPLTRDANGYPVMPTQKLEGHGPWSTPLSRAAKVFFQLPPGVRRNVASTMLFTFHPLLVLTPTESFLDTPDDHPAPPVTNIEDVWRDLPADKSSEESRSSEDSTDVFCYGFGPDIRGTAYGEPAYLRAARRRAQKCKWFRTLRQYSLIKTAEPLPAPPQLALNDSAAASSTAPCPNPGCNPVQPANTVCPWHPQPIVDRHAEQLSDPGVTRDVLTNMECQVKARKLLEQAEMLCHTGHLCEALDCFEMVEELCPGRFDDRIQSVMTDLCVRLYGVEPVKNEVARIPPSEEQEAPAESQGGFWQSFLGYFRWPLRCHDHEQDATETDSEASECPKCEELHRRFVTRCARKTEKEPLVFVTYPVSDLVSGEVSLDYREGDTSRGRRDQNMPAEEWLIKFLLSDIQPASWYEMGGKGTIDYYPLTQSLVVGQTANNQEKVAEALARIRLQAQEKLGIRTQVTGLLKACRLALADGRPGQASDLLRQAYALDPERVLADPLAFRMQMLLDEGKACSGGAEESSTPDYACPFLKSLTVAKSGPLSGSSLASFAAAGKEIGKLLDTLFPAHGGVEIGLGFPPGQLSLGYSLPMGNFVFHIRYRGGSVNVWMTSKTMAKDR